MDLPQPNCPNVILTKSVACPELLIVLSSTLTLCCLVVNYLKFFSLAKRAMTSNSGCFANENNWGLITLGE